MCARGGWRGAGVRRGWFGIRRTAGGGGRSRLAGLACLPRPSAGALWLAADVLRPVCGRLCRRLFGLFAGGCGGCGAIFGLFAGGCVGGGAIFGLFAGSCVGCGTVFGLAAGGCVGGDLLDGGQIAGKDVVCVDFVEGEFCEGRLFEQVRAAELKARKDAVNG